MRFTHKWIAAALCAAGVAAIGLGEAGAATENEKLGEVVVTATRNDIALKDAPGSVTVVTAEEIKDIPANDILDIIRETVGVSLISRGVGGRAAISIRGLESEQTLVLVDGKRVPASSGVFGHSDFEQNWMSIENIERIEVVRGPLSALYGSEAMGGVINIITKKSTDEWHGSTRIGGGFRDDDNGGESHAYGAQLSGPILREKLGMSVTAEYMKDEEVPDPDEPRYSELEEKEVSSVGTKLTFTPTDNQTFEAGVDIIEDDRMRNTVSSGKDYEDAYALDKVITSLSWDGELGPVRSAVKAYRSDIDKNSVKTYTNGTVATYPERLTDDILDAQAAFDAWGSFVTLGGELWKEDLESTSLAGGGDDITHQALFFQDELPLFGSRLRLTPGVRYDDHESFGEEVSPRLYALYKLTDQVNLKAGYGHAFRAPTIKQVSEGYYATSGPHSFVGNPDVGPETSDAYEAGVEYFGDVFFTRVMGFYNAIEDLITTKQIAVSGSRRTYTYVNVDSAETMGVETEVGVPLPHGFEVSTGYTYLEARDEENDVRLEGKPRHSVAGKITYALPKEDFTAVLRTQYIADQLLSNDAGTLEEAPDYVLWHVSLRKGFLKQFEAQVGVDNIGDVRITDKSDLYTYEERGRTYYANLRYKF